MPLPSLPAIEDEIRQIIELKTQHEELARTAQVNEEVLGDLAFGSETNTRSFMTIFQQLKTIFNFFVALHTTGRLHPAPLASLMFHFRHNIDAETRNAQNYLAILPLEERHDTEHHRHADILSDLEHRHIVLLAVKNETRLREQGVQDTHLQDIDLNV
jgi:hypothetical protein